jgi:hypothetical protein
MLDGTVASAPSAVKPDLPRVIRHKTTGEKSGPFLDYEGLRKEVRFLLIIIPEAIKGFI